MAGKKSLVYGIGINDSDYLTEISRYIYDQDGVRKRKRIWFCPFFRKWSSMLMRCYCEKYLERKPTYRGCTVCEEWLTFSNFKAWMETQEWAGNHLDKDLLIQGNKVYSPETCIFVPSIVNTFLNDCAASRGVYPIGVHLDKRRNELSVKCCNPFTGKPEHLGTFPVDQVLIAGNAWKARKAIFAAQLAALQKDSRVSQALMNHSSYCDGHSSDSEFTKETVELLLERSVLEYSYH